MNERDFCDELLDISRRITRTYFRAADLEIEIKGDESPVTQADKEIERELRAKIEDAYPQDGIIGEEYGRKKSSSGRYWILDPIDGTKSFTIGRPTFGTLIGLWEDDETPLFGVIDQPIIGDCWIGQKNEVTTHNGHNLPYACHPRQSRIVGSTSPSQIEKFPDHALIRSYADAQWQWGGDCFFYGLLANGWMDAVIESGLKIHDYAAVIPVLQGAGVNVTDWDDEPLTLNSDGFIHARRM